MAGRPAVRTENPVAKLPSQRLPYLTAEAAYPGAMQAILDNIASRPQAKVAKTRGPEDMEWHLAWERNLPPEHITNEDQILLWMKHNNKAYLRAHTGKQGGQLIIGEELHVLPDSVVAGFRRSAKSLAESRQRAAEQPILLTYDEPLENVQVSKPIIKDNAEVDPRDAFEMWVKDHPHHNKRLAAVMRVLFSEIMGV